MILILAPMMDGVLLFTLRSTLFRFITFPFMIDNPLAGMVINGLELGERPSIVKTFEIVN